MPEELDETQIHGNDPRLMAKWATIKEIRERNKFNGQLLAQLNAGLDPNSMLGTRIGMLMGRLLTPEQQLDFEIEYEQMMETLLVEAQSVRRKEMLAAPNIPPEQLDAMMRHLDQFRNGRGPGPQGPSSGGLYRGRG
jgi:tetrahydromethanopterin S-methyltransferase subunit F